MAVLDKKLEDQTPVAPIDEETSGGGEKVYVASPMLLMWWRFRKHKMAMISGVVLIIFYLIAVFCEFASPYDADNALLQFKQAPPTEIHIRDAAGNFQWPFVYQHKRAMDPQTLQITFTEDTSIKYPIQLFAK